MFRRAFWVPTLERALKSGAQGAIGVMAGDWPFDVWDADWKRVTGGLAGMALLSLLTSIGSYRLGPTGSPSVVADPEAAPPREGEHRPDPDGHVRVRRPNPAREDVRRRLVEHEEFPPPPTWTGTT